MPTRYKIRTERDISDTALTAIGTIGDKVDKVAGSRLITTAEGTILSNTSGTNSGDNATNTQYSGLATSKLSLDQTTSQSIINGQPIQNTLTASQIVATDASKKLQTLAVATYPSLTELTYVKGVTSAIQTQIGNQVPKSLYDANTILYATTDNTPAALTVGASTFVGRKATNGISAMSATEARTILNVANGATANTKATGAELNTGTDDVKFATAKAIADSLIASGWTPARETWEFVSVDDPTGVFRVNADVTGKYSVGMRIKFTNATNVIYGIITVVGAYTGGYTSITFLHQIDTTDNLALYLMANSAITVNYYSTQKVPFGFPLETDKWSVTIIDTASRTQGTPTNTTWYNLGSRTISIPIGCWNIYYKCDVWAVATAGRIDLSATLSTANNSASDNLYTVRNLFSSVSLAGLFATYSGKLAVTSKTSYYLNLRVSEATSPSTLGSDGSQSNAIIKAICSYL